ncbi:MAG TPA: cytidine deaminase [Mycobacteriales bacterium]|nr:cytidine deaminase [Mycobacteriales bacterium]
MTELEAEDAKLVVLARAARGRAYAPHAQGRTEGAAVRDTDGRTYTAATVEHADPALTTSALRGAVAAAASSGARAFEAAVVVSDAADVDPSDADVLREFGAGVPLILASVDGDVTSSRTT